MKSRSEENNDSQSKLPLIISGVVLAAAVASYFLIPEVNSFLKEAYNTLTSENETRISRWVDRLGLWGPLFVIVAMSLQMFLLVIPSPLLIIISILAYGPFWGSVLSVTAVAIASTLGYFIGSYLGQTFINKLIGAKKEKKLTYYVNRYGVWTVVITRITPILSNDAISLVSGILRMSYWKFIAATISGITPLVILIAWFGESNERLKNGLIWTSLISLVILIVYIIIDRQKQRESGEKPHHKK